MAFPQYNSLKKAFGEQMCNHSECCSWGCQSGSTECSTFVPPPKVLKAKPGNNLQHFSVNGMTRSGIEPQLAANRASILPMGHGCSQNVIMAVVKKVWIDLVLAQELMTPFQTEVLTYQKGPINKVYLVWNRTQKVLM